MLFCTDEEKKMNASYIISVARKLGCSIFLLPEDILEVIWSIGIEKSNFLSKKLFFFLFLFLFFFCFHSYYELDITENLSFSDDYAGEPKDDAYANSNHHVLALEKADK